MWWRGREHNVQTTTNKRKHKVQINTILNNQLILIICYLVFAILPFYSAESKYLGII